MLASKVVEKSQKLEEVQRETAAANAARFVDTVTGLGEPPGFNKEIAKIYEKSGLPDLCGIAFADIDGYETIAAVPNLLEPVLEENRRADPGDLQQGRPGLPLRSRSLRFRFPNAQTRRKSCGSSTGSAIE